MFSVERRKNIEHFWLTLVYYVLLQARVRGFQARQHVVYEVREAFEALASSITHEALELTLDELPESFADLCFLDNNRLHLPVSPSR